MEAPGGFEPTASGLCRPPPYRTWLRRLGLVKLDIQDLTIRDLRLAVLTLYPLRYSSSQTQVRTSAARDLRTPLRPGTGGPEGCVLSLTQGMVTTDSP